jgi:methyl-accepting chemotaxis protein
VRVKVGQTGYVYVVDSKGNYVISQNGKRDGENLWESKDNDGKLFIQELVAKAGKLGPREIGEYSYPWKNPQDPTPRLKVVRIVYFQPWDWIIGVGSYLDEFLEGTNKLEAAARRGYLWNDIFHKLLEDVTKCAELINEITAASREQAQGTEQVNQAVGEMDKVVQRNAASAEETASASQQLDAQTEGLKELVITLLTLIGGANREESRNSSAVARSEVSSNVHAQNPKAMRIASLRSGKGKGGSKTLLPRKSPTAATKPENAIRFDDSDSEGF